MADPATSGGRLTKPPPAHGAAAPAPAPATEATSPGGAGGNGATPAEPAAEPSTEPAARGAEAATTSAPAPGVAHDHHRDPDAEPQHSVQPGGYTCTGAPNPNVPAHGLHGPCARKCDSRPLCTTFVFVPATGGCALWSAGAAPTARTASGSSTCSKSAPGAQFALATVQPRAPVVRLRALRTPLMTPVHPRVPNLSAVHLAATRRPCNGRLGGRPHVWPRARVLRSLGCQVCHVVKCGGNSKMLA